MARLEAGLLARPYGLAAGPSLGSGGRVPGEARELGNLVPVRPIGPPRLDRRAAYFDLALPLLETPLALLDLPLASRLRGRAAAARPCAWPPPGWRTPRGVHYRVASAPPPGPAERPGTLTDIPGGGEVVGFASWREGLEGPARGPGVRGWTTWPGRGCGWSTASQGAQARALLDRERLRLRLDPAELLGYEPAGAAGRLQRGGGHRPMHLADAGVSSEPAALACWLDFILLAAAERFDLVLLTTTNASREVQGLLKVLTSPMVAGSARQSAQLRRWPLRRAPILISTVSISAHPDQRARS